MRNQGISTVVSKNVLNTGKYKSHRLHPLTYWCISINASTRLTSKGQLSPQRRRRERCGARIGLYSAFKIGGSFASFASNEPLFTSLRLGSRCWLYAQLARVDSRFSFWRVGVPLFLSGIPGSVVLSPRVRVSRSVFYFLARSSTPAQRLKTNTDGVTRTHMFKGRRCVGWVIQQCIFFSPEGGTLT